jgi:hypothetical protein
VALELPSPFVTESTTLPLFVARGQDGGPNRRQQDAPGIAIFEALRARTCFVETREHDERFDPHRFAFLREESHGVPPLVSSDGLKGLVAISPIQRGACDV